MDDLDMLARDFGFGPRGKSNPMRSNLADHPRSVSRSSVEDPIFSNVFGGSPNNPTNENTSFRRSSRNPLASEFDHDSIFRPLDSKKDNTNSGNASSLPVYDKPVYDEDIFDGLPGLKSKPVSSAVRLNDDVFTSNLSPQSSKSRNKYGDFSDLLGSLGRDDKVEENNRSSYAKSNSASQGFEDLLGGLGAGSYSANGRSILESNGGSHPAAGSKHSSGVVHDPFVVFESTSTAGSASTKSFTDPLEDISKFGQVRSAHIKASSGGGGVFKNLDPLSNFDNPVQPHSPKRDNVGKDGSPSRSATPQSGSTRGLKEGISSVGYSDSNSEKRVHMDKFPESPSFNKPNVLEDFQKSLGQSASSPPYDVTGSQVDMNHSSGRRQQNDEIWLTVSEIPLFTQPTEAPPPSRPPPPIPGLTSRSEAGKASTISQIDELDNTAPENSFRGSTDLHSTEETNAFSAAAAMKDAMDKAEAKFRQAKEVREREYAKSVKSRESMQMDKDERSVLESEWKETQERIENERNRKEEREHLRIERERERERERARQAVERANREAHERLAVEAHERATAEARLKLERAAVQRVQAEARERAAAEAKEKAQKAAAEARERAAAEAKERVEKAAAEAKERAERAAAAEAKERAERAASEAMERAATEAREKEAANKASAARAEAESKRRAERAAFERASAEARERAAAEAREKMAAAAKARQQKNDNDLDSFFGAGRASSAPRSRENSTASANTGTNKGVPDAAKMAPGTSGLSSNIKKSPSTTNIIHDLTSIFGAAQSSGEFQDIEGESDERKKARLDRFQRTQERAAKALAEKNQRDIQAQRDQEERHRIGETLDIEIKRWAAGKEGNLRALLSTLQYVLWPECGWQPVSLTDLIVGASVKKVYRKATLCIHPDKVQQKGATLQQKYIAEKVFDLLKEAWNKFNSEELF